MRRLRDDRSGVAIIEFAIGLPVFLMAILYGVDVANLALMHQRLSQVSTQVANTAARGATQIDEADVDQIMTAAEITAGGDTGLLRNGRVILSSVRQNAAGTGQWIEWQRCEGDAKTVSAYGVEGKGKNDASLQSVGTSSKITVPLGADLMLVELSYVYQPIVPNSFVGHPTIKTETAFIVRERTTFAIKNDTGLTGSNIKTC